MGLIVLEGMQFHAYHGVHPEERVMGGAYQVDVYLTYPFEGNGDRLEKTANYEEVYRLVALRMQQPVALIEHLAELMLSDLSKGFGEATGIKVGISKFAPPVGGVVGRAYVEVSI